MPRFPLGTAASSDVDAEAVTLLAGGTVARAATENGTPVWLALGHNEVRQVLSDQRFSRAAAAGVEVPNQLLAANDPNLLPSMDPPKHARVRRLVAKAFTPRMVDALAPRVQAIVDELLSGMHAHGSPADLVALFAEPLPIMVICELMGVPYADRARIRAWSHRLVSTTGYPIEEIMTALAEIYQYLTELVAAKRGQPAADLTSELVKAYDDGAAGAAERTLMSESELVAHLQTLLIAGHETTVNQLGNSIVALLRHRDQLALLRSRPELIEPAVDELLRYARLASSMLPRVTVDEVELGGQRLGAGEVVIAVIGAGNVDPAVFDEPHRLDITRDNAAHHLSFGHGTHYCLGAHLARLELRTALRSLLDRMPGLALAVDESELRWREGTPLRALQALPVVW